MRRLWVVAVLAMFVGGAHGAADDTSGVCSIQASGSATDDTSRLQGALAACAGAYVRIMPGEYHTGPLFLASATTFEVEQGATLSALDDPDRYRRPDGGLYALINASDASEVTLTGGGTIDGNGGGWWQRFRAAQQTGQTPDARPRLVVFERCTHMRVSGLTLQNSPSFHLVLRGCTDVSIDGLKITAPWDSPNTDGVDPMASHDIRIADLFIDTGDDNVAVKSGTVDPDWPEAGSSDIAITNCTFGHGHGVSIGSETNGGVQNVTVTDSQFTQTQSGIRIKTNREVGGPISNLTYANLMMNGVQQPIAFASYYPSIPEADAELLEAVTPTTPNLTNVVVSRLVATGAARAGWIVGLPEKPYRSVLLDDVTIASRSGLQVRNASVSLHQVNVSIEVGLPFVVENNAQLDWLTSEVAADSK